MWTDRNIRAGAEWSQTIETALESSQIVILIVSESFLSSEYIKNVELKRALDAADEGKKTVLWVYARKVMSVPERLKGWQAAHDIKTPLERVIDVQSREQQLFKIYDALEGSLESLKKLARERP